MGANIAEGAGRGSYQDNRRFIVIARGSLFETQYWLRRAFARGLLSEPEINVLKLLVDELGPRLNACPRAIGGSLGVDKKKPIPNPAGNPTSNGK